MCVVSTWGRSNPDDETSELAPRLERVGRQPARWRVLIAGIGVALVMGTLWLKPWDRPGRTAVAVPPAQTNATPLPEPTPVAPKPAEPTPISSLDPEVILAARARQ